MSEHDKTPLRHSPEGSTADVPRKPWAAPTVSELPKLQNLTLQTGGIIGGGQSTFP